MKTKRKTNNTNRIRFQWLKNPKVLLALVVVTVSTVGTILLAISNAQTGPVQLLNYSFDNQLSYWNKRGGVSWHIDNGGVTIAEIYSPQSQGASVYQDITLPQGCFQAFFRARGVASGTNQATLAVWDITAGNPKIVTTKTISLSESSYTGAYTPLTFHSSISNRFRIEVYNQTADKRIALDQVKLIDRGCRSTAEGVRMVAVAQKEVGKAGTYTEGGFWCSKFLSWVAFNAGVSDFPYGDSPNNQFYFYKNQNEISTTPAPGMLVFVDLTGSNFANQYITHAGLVESVNPDGSVNTIEGNSRDNGVVNRERRKYGDGYVIGYAHPTWPVPTK